ncbi:3-oxoacyl-ACP reductase FabG [Caryophanon latum]|uniref:3-oxoacyl-[acyl-carrier-protein] reductase n=1 Tax=Caryophanon latum TaxID=33977 RepID=A0A1C0YV57_9BACL|nr:3-oxoacyl-ACP reductase FabG [Caryophanon latum]OCS91038.1 3-oxoacyl-[acyl-carrier-protein] reductase [Caryophanon latum]
MRLQHKVAIITGGAKGIGEAAVKRFTEEGAKVVIADMDEAAGNVLVQTLTAEGKDVHFVKTNVADRESVAQLVAETIDKFGTIDILINNAGITNDAMLTKMTAEQFQKVLDVNLTGVFNCTQAVLPTLIEKGAGKIVNTSSVSGTYGNVGQTNYAATKAAVIGMTKTWAKELGRKGINVNAVAPGFTRTDLVAKMPEKVIEKMTSVIAQQRLGEPVEIANAYLYLASGESNYVNGHVLHVDGGIMM